MLGAWPLLSVANGDGCFPHRPTAHAHCSPSNMPTVAAHTRPPHMPTVLPRTCLRLLPAHAHRTCPPFSLEHAYCCSRTCPPDRPTVLPRTCLLLLPHMPTGQAHRLPRTCLLLLPTQAHRTCPLFSLEHAYCCCPHISNLVPRTYRLLSRHHGAFVLRTCPPLFGM